MSQTFNYILNGLTRHQIFVERLGGRYKNDLLPILIDASRDIRRLINDAPTEAQLYRLAQTGGAIDEILRSVMNEFGDQLDGKLLEFAEYEPSFVARLLDNATTHTFAIPAVERVVALYTDEHMRLLSGKSERVLTIHDAVRTLSQSASDKILRTIRDGVVTGKTLNEMVASVSEYTKTRMLTDAEAVVRTAVNHVGSEARKAVYAQNVDVIAVEEWVSVLDHRTTLICAKLDGTQYPVGQGIYPPRHYRCRSIRLPVTIDKINKVIKGVPSKKDKENNYSVWLKRQPEAVQNEVLGVERAKLFRAGAVTLNGFADSTGKVYTLEELQALEGLTLQ